MQLYCNQCDISVFVESRLKCFCKNHVCVSQQCYTFIQKRAKTRKVTKFKLHCCNETLKHQVPTYCYTIKHDHIHDTVKISTFQHNRTARKDQKFIYLYLEERERALYNTMHFLLQVINRLSPDELQTVLNRHVFHPRTFIIKPQHAVFMSGLARVDFLQVFIKMKQLLLQKICWVTSNDDFKTWSATLRTSNVFCIKLCVF